MSLGEWLILIAILIFGLCVLQQLRAQTKVISADLRLRITTADINSRQIEETLNRLEAIVSRAESPWSEKNERSQYETYENYNNMERLLNSVENMSGDMRDLANTFSDYTQFVGMPEGKELQKLLRKIRTNSKKRD